MMDDESVSTLYNLAPGFCHDKDESWMIHLPHKHRLWMKAQRNTFLVLTDELDRQLSELKLLERHGKNLRKLTSLKKNYEVHKEKQVVMAKDLAIQIKILQNLACKIADHVRNQEKENDTKMHRMGEVGLTTSSGNVELDKNDEYLPRNIGDDKSAIKLISNSEPSTSDEHVTTMVQPVKKEAGTQPYEKSIGPDSTQPKKSPDSSRPPFISALPPSSQNPAAPSTPTRPITKVSIQITPASVRKSIARPVLTQSCHVNRYNKNVRLSNARTILEIKLPDQRIKLDISKMGTRLSLCVRITRKGLMEIILSSRESHSKVPDAIEPNKCKHRNVCNPVCVQLI